MRKKWMMAGAGFGIGAMLLLVTGFTAMANTSGYDAYKTALKNTKAKTSLTAKVDMTVTDNGKEVLTGTSNFKLNQVLNSGSIAATMGNGTQTHSFQVFRQDGKVVFKNSEDDVYRVMEQNTPKWHREEGASNPPKVMEQVIDSLMGNIQELATVENEADGGKLAKLQLSGNQIPTVVNVLGTFIVSKAANHDQWDHSNWNQAETSSATHAKMKVDIPKLTDNITVEKIMLGAEISSDDVLEQQTADITIAGTDSSGNHHELDIHLKVNFTDFNQTVPEHIDLMGKKTQEIQKEGRKFGWHQ